MPSSPYLAAPRHDAGSVVTLWWDLAYKAGQIMFSSFQIGVTCMDRMTRLAISSAAPWTAPMRLVANDPMAEEQVVPPTPPMPEPASPPMPSPTPDPLPPEIDDPPPVEVPSPVHEPPVMPTPVAAAAQAVASQQDSPYLTPLS